jgi:sulfite exporter TauE/SafE
LFLPALILGIIGSLHCMGMCGPISIAANMGTGSGTQRIARGLLYQSGRVGMYALLGLMVGLVGERLAVLGIQRWVSIAAGVLVIVAMALPAALRQRLDPTTLLGRYFLRLKGHFNGLMRSRSIAAPLGLGALNGLLPCGMVYMALAGAIAVGSTWGSAAYMAVFGLGTLPTLFAIYLAADLISMGHRRLMVRVWPYAIALVGALFILRGLELGIPYISPAALAHAGSGAQCY